MGKKDVAIKPWLKNKQRFADLFNGVCFGGKQVVKSEELIDLDSESTLVLRDKNNNFNYVQRHRDLCQLWNNVVLRAQLCGENQDKVHYAMPVKNMLMDSMSYTDQIKSVWNSIPKEEKKKLIGSADHFSNFRKEDKLCPVITLVLYWGDDWDGSMDLYDMFDLEGVRDDDTLMDFLHKYVPNYPINLFSPYDTDNLSVFKTDLQKVFGVLQCRYDKQRLRAYVKEHEDYFGCMDYDSVNAMIALLDAEKHIKNNSWEEENNLCKALEDWYNDSLEEGREQGREQGLEKMSKLNVILIKANRLDDLARASEDDEYRDKLFLEYNL